MLEFHVELAVLRAARTKPGERPNRPSAPAGFVGDDSAWGSFLETRVRLLQAERDRDLRRIASLARTDEDWRQVAKLERRLQRTMPGFPALSNSDHSNDEDHPLLKARAALMAKQKKRDRAGTRVHAD
jgi:hypothetical protein